MQGYRSALSFLKLEVYSLIPFGDCIFPSSRFLIYLLISALSISMFAASQSQAEHHEPDLPKAAQQERS